MMMQAGYIMKRNGEYLTAVRETDQGILYPIFGIYKYDAARVPTERHARHIIRGLYREGESWQIYRFHPLSGDERLMTCTRG